MCDEGEESGSHQVVERDALLLAAHVLEEAVVGHQQKRAGVLLVVVGLPLLSVQELCRGAAHSQRGPDRRGRLRTDFRRQQTEETVLALTRPQRRPPFRTKRKAARDDLTQHGQKADITTP